MEKTRTEEFKGNGTRSEGQWILWLTVVVCIAAIPGIFFSPFSIHFFDEPYQILNAIDWKNSVYSPLSAWFGNVFGNLAGWNFVGFRYLTLFLILTPIYFSGVYVLQRIRNKRAVLLICGLCVYLSSIFRASFNIYGWDCWTTFFVTLTLLSTLSYFRCQSYPKVILIGVLSGFTVLLRLPNITVVVFEIVILLSIGMIDQDIRRRRTFGHLIIYLISVIATILIALSFLYGSVAHFYLQFEANHINSHPLPDIVLAFIEGLRNDIFFVLVFWVSYLVYKYVCSNSPRAATKWILGAFITCLFLALIVSGSPEYLFNVNTFMAAGVTFTLLSILFIKWDYDRKRKIMACVILFLLCCVPAIGSNNGYAKILTFPAVPVLYMVIEPALKRGMKEVGEMVAIALVMYSFIGPLRHTFWDGGYPELTYRVDGGVLDGVRTTPERGAFLQKVYDRVQTFANEGYEIIPVRRGDDYIWEYMWMRPNRFQRHTFNSPGMLNDVKYVGAMMEDIRKSHQPVLVLLIRDPEFEEATLMQDTLDKEMRIVEGNKNYKLYVR